MLNTTPCMCAACVAERYFNNLRGSALWQNLTRPVVAADPFDVDGRTPLDDALDDPRHDQAAALNGGKTW